MRYLYALTLFSASIMVLGITLSDANAGRTHEHGHVYSHHQKRTTHAVVPIPIPRNKIFSADKPPESYPNREFRSPDLRPLPPVVTPSVPKGSKMDSILNALNTPLFASCLSLGLIIYFVLRNGGPSVLKFFRRILGHFKSAESAVTADLAKFKLDFSVLEARVAAIEGQLKNGLSAVFTKTTP